MDDPRLAALGLYTPEQELASGFGDHYVFFAGRDDLHGILLAIIQAERLEFDFDMYGYADDELNKATDDKIEDPSVVIQGTLDSIQAGGAHEKRLLALDSMRDPIRFGNSIAVGQSATHQISHTKGGVLVSQGIWFEGSTNWSAAGEGVGISLKANVKNPAGFVAQNNTLLVSVNPVGLNRFRTRLGIEHRIALAQQAAKKATVQG